MSEFLLIAMKTPTGRVAYATTTQGHFTVTMRENGTMAVRIETGETVEDVVTITCEPVDPATVVEVPPAAAQ